MAFQRIVFPALAIKIFIFLLILPFLTLTDFYPFFRYGMFAEPIDNKKPSERFEVHIVRGNQSEPWHLDSLGLSEGQINYLGRKYYYTGKSTEFLVDLAKGTDIKNVSIQLLKIELDTVCVAQLVR